MMPRRRFIDAVREALRAEMAADPSVIVLGEDVEVGGPYGVTKGLAAAFGGRVLNTPISEGTVMGLAVGAAATGMRPVLEVMFVDFITLGMDQLVNHGAKLSWMTAGQLQVPLTVRAQFGVAGGYGAHHSQSLESWFLHVPGLKVAMPSCPEDARGLLISAIRDPDPVLYLEHRALYFTTGEVAEARPVPFGRAAVRRPGRDVTVVATARMVDVALEAAARLAEGGIEAEVVDPRTLTPLDLETIVGSVRRTGRLVVAMEAVTRGSAGAEIAAQVQEAAFDHLDAPVLRVGAPFTPVPAAPSLERAYLPGVESVAQAVRALCGGG
jgi:pyruvate/2-oxoglutarate/acetoin dehydrogenase E1 component